MEKFTDRGGFCAGVSLDIKNAFNSIPWGCIIRALKDSRCPRYLIKIIVIFFGTVDLFLSRGGVELHYRVRKGVPQGSVPGPLLWNMTYNKILNVALPIGCSLVCFADDTLVLVGGLTLPQMKIRFGMVVEKLLMCTDSLGLEIATDKTEMLVFGGRKGEEIEMDIVINVGKMRYLGIILDGNWDFGAHIEWVAKKAEKLIKALVCLLPNLKGPGEKKRRLYASAMRSIILYGAPIWADERVLKNMRKMAPIVRVQRRIDQRTVSAYCMVSGVATGLLARSPSIDIVAKYRRWMHYKLRVTETGRTAPGSRAQVITPVIKNKIRVESQGLIAREWRERLSGEDPRLAGARARPL